MKSPTLLYDDVIEPQFHLSLLHDSLLYGVLGDEAEHTHLLLLTNTMGAVLGMGFEKYVI